MRQLLTLALLVGIFGNGRTLAGDCSSRNGQKYCSCQFDQMCTSSEVSCACTGAASQPPSPIRMPTSPRSSQQSVTRTREEPRGEHTSVPPATVTAPHVASTADNDERTPIDYVHLAQAAVAAGRLAAAIDFIDKGQTRLLDRSVALFKTFDPITDESIKQLNAAKQALLARNSGTATKSLNDALAAMR